MLIHHPEELATYLLSYFKGCIALVRCVLVLRCGLAGVVCYPDAGLGACDLFVELFHGLYCSGSMRVGVVSVCSASACIRLPHHPSQTTT